jgi:hypothetical protein
LQSHRTLVEKLIEFSGTLAQLEAATALVELNGSTSVRARLCSDIDFKE